VETTRTFVAIEIGEAGLDQLDRIVQKLRSSVDGFRWTRTDHLHVTVKFLGDVDNRDLPEICLILKEACQDLQPFGLRLRGLGTFPKGRPPRVIWAGIEQEEGQSLQTLHDVLNSRLTRLGVAREGRAFSPHVTIGRAKRGTRGGSLASQLESIGEGLNVDFSVEQVQLLASQKENGGVRYDPICTVELSHTLSD
jgi:2'-5' RNA ligase